MRQDLNRKYGRIDNSAYAVVTGGSDGIGLEMCHQLAEQGFNICMISRNKVKVDEKLAQIKQKYPGC
jgi:short-subunit dehydrogenase